MSGHKDGGASALTKQSSDVTEGARTECPSREALWDLHEFIENVGGGHFYEDYDASMELLGKARKAHKALQGGDLA
jgi:hypothetical protein